MAEFGFESTTDEVLVGQDLSGKTAFVTGGMRSTLPRRHGCGRFRNAWWARNSPFPDGSLGMPVILESSILSSLQAAIYRGGHIANCEKVDSSASYLNGSESIRVCCLSKTLISPT
jgi:hypothetical protein